MHMREHKSTVAPLPEEIPLDMEPEVTVIARCRRCADRPSQRNNKPPALAKVGRFSNGRWSIQRADRRDKPSHDAQARAGKLPGGVYNDTPQGKRFIQAWDWGTNAMIGRIVCRVCNRRLPIGWKQLIELAAAAIKTGKPDFLA